MTEQQFEKIKALLDASTPIKNSSDVDNAILKSAAEHAELNKQYDAGESQPGNIVTRLFSWFGSLINGLAQGSFAQAAVLSVLFTFAFLLSMAQILKTDEPVIALQETNVEFAPNKTQKSVAKKTRVKPVLAFEMPETQRARDQILASTPLPDIQLMLNVMVLDVDGDQQSAKKEILIAMDDIRFMLDNGQLNDARLRYAKLKARCFECSLPDSLEALLATPNRSFRRT